jgi:hypothetical protein
MQRNSPLVGVGGWLAFLIAGFAILGPFVGLGQMIDEFDTTEKAFPQLVANAAWLQYKRITWGVFVVTAAISIAAGYRLWKVHVQQSVRFAILALWLVGPVGYIVQMLVTVVSFGSRAMGHVGPKMIMGLLVSSMGAALWTAYLRRSRRVKNTYAPTAGATDTSQTSEHIHAERLQSTVAWLQTKSTAELQRLYQKGGHSAEGREALRRVLMERLEKSDADSDS